MSVRLAPERGEHFYFGKSPHLELPVLQLHPFDPVAPVAQQLGETQSPVVLVSDSTVDALGAYPSNAVAWPHLFAKVAVANLCTV